MKNKNLLLVLSVAFTFLISLQCFAQGTYYVDYNFGDDINNTGAITSPFKTIGKAVSKIPAPGSIVYVHGGIYPLTTTLSISASKTGTKAKPNYLVNFPGERPILDCSGVPAGSRGISLAASYFHVKGLDIKKAHDNGMRITGDNNVVEFCTFSENDDTGLQLAAGADSNLILNCDSYFNKDATGENADGFACKLDVGTNNAFKGCRAWQNSDDGWDGYLRPSDNINTFLDSCWSFRNGYLKSGSLSGPNGDGNGFKMGGSDLQDLRHNMTLTHCLAFNNRKRGFDQNNNKGSMILYNNTAFANNPNFGLNSNNLAAGSVMIVKNCISLSSNGTNSFLAVATLQNNSWVGSSRVDLQACKLEYSIVSPK